MANTKGQNEIIYWKIAKGDEIVDVNKSDEIVYVAYQMRNGMFLRCDDKSQAQGVVASDGSCTYLINSFLDNYEPVASKYDKVKFYEIDEEEYKVIKEALDSDKIVPAPPEEEEVVPEPEEPTEEEIVDEATLKLLKEKYIKKTKTMLATFLEKNPITSTAHNETPGLYSVTEEKYTQLTCRMLSYELESRALGKESADAHLTWNETGKPCELWKYEELVQLGLEIQAFVIPRVSMQQYAEVAILNCTNFKDIKAIVDNLDYSEVVTNETT